jgi:hypothetical protein
MDTENIFHREYVYKGHFTQVFEVLEDVFVGCGQEQLNVLGGDGLIDLSRVDVDHHCYECFVGHFFFRSKINGREQREVRGDLVEMDCGDVHQRRSERFVRHFFLDKLNKRNVGVRGGGNELVSHALLMPKLK